MFLADQENSPRGGENWLKITGCLPPTRLKAMQREEERDGRVACCALVPNVGGKEDDAMNSE